MSLVRPKKVTQGFPRARKTAPLQSGARCKNCVGKNRQIGLVVSWLVSLEQIKTNNILFERA